MFEPVELIKRSAKTVLGSPRELAQRVQYPAYYRKLPESQLSPGQRRSWREEGLLVLPAFFDGKRIDEINELIETLWRERKKYSGLVADYYLDQPGGKRGRFSDLPEDAIRRPIKINDLYLEFSQVRNLCLDARLGLILEELLGAPPLVCNTLNFIFGSGQPDHVDSLFMRAPKEDKLVATWMALEDVSEEAGPLKYYPGSHKIPPHIFSNGSRAYVEAEMTNFYRYMEGECGRRNITSKTFLAKKGDVFIWDSNLLHGGTSIKNPQRTRKSLVTHYWRARDLGREHGTIGEGRYYLIRPPAPLS